MSNPLIHTNKVVFQDNDLTPPHPFPNKGATTTRIREGKPIDIYADARHACGRMPPGTYIYRSPNGEGGFWLTHDLDFEDGDDFQLNHTVTFRHVVSCPFCGTRLAAAPLHPFRASSASPLVASGIPKPLSDLVAYLKALPGARFADALEEGAAALELGDVDSSRLACQLADRWLLGRLKAYGVEAERHGDRVAMRLAEQGDDRDGGRGDD